MANKQTPATAAIRNGRPVLLQRRTDLRGQRTKLAIQNAFIELAKQRGFNAVSVRDVAKQAMINRATFYRYYKDKYYLAEDLFKNAVRTVEVSIGPRVFSKQSELNRALGEKRAHAAWQSLFEHFAANSQIYGPLLGGNGSAWFLEQMRQDLMNSFKRIQRTHQSEVPIEVAQCFFASAIIGITYFWLRHGMKYSASQMAAWFRLIAFRGYIGVIAGL